MKRSELAVDGHSSAHALSSEHAEDWLGRVIDQRYEILELIGRGGMGVVYRVRHTRMGKVAALKRIHPALAHNAAIRRRFHNEAEAVSRLNHPNIVHVFDYGEADNTPFLVMEYVPGEDLRGILKRDGRMDIFRCLPAAMQVCDALAEAHAHGVIHRDLKPANIRLSRARDGVDLVKVLDFGLAKIIADDPQAARMTEKGRLVGTPYYMSPEQIRSTDLDPRCDIYSLGAVLYRMLTGQPAFSADTAMGVLTKHVSEALVPPSEVLDLLPPSVDDLIGRAMAKDRSERFDDALSMKRAIRRLGASLETREVITLGFSDQATHRRRASDRHRTTMIPNLPDSQRSPALVAVPNQRNIASTASLPVLAEQADISTNPSPAEPGAPIVEPTQATELLGPDDLLFERRWRRRRVLKATSITMLVAAAAVAAAFYAFNPFVDRALPLTAELEPNNRVDQATPIQIGVPISGGIGRRLTTEQSDRDWYAFDVPGTTPQMLSAQLSAVFNIDLVLEVYDVLGGRLLRIDSAGVGGQERLFAWPLAPGKYYALVREYWKAGRTPTENVSDRYRLTLKLSGPQLGWEREPNDKPSQAQQLVGDAVSAVLGSGTDIDCFRLAPTKPVVVHVSAVPGVDLVVETYDSAGRRVATTDSGVLGRPERLTLPAGQFVIAVRGKRSGKPAPGAELPGLGVPYRLAVRGR
ncbi:MAG: serine/threonine protein kinase [Deltaproteobacteria bacterium]|nr:serine/threonine protein kinase [Deltaproteobacteria bacterium]